MESKYTYVEKEIAATGNGDLEEWSICAKDDGSYLARTWSEHLANVIQQAIENDIAENEKNCWE